MTNIDELKKARFLNLGTYRKSGKRVDTPLWAVAKDGAFYAFSEDKAGKVKRLRNSPKATLAVCDRRGGLLGPWLEAEATIVQDAEEVAAAYEALVEKYGWSVRIITAFSKLTGRYRNLAVLKMVPNLQGNRSDTSHGQVSCSA
jgi:PPOX class probable F420-dependent enzyme